MPGGGGGVKIGGGSDRAAGVKQSCATSLFASAWLQVCVFFTFGGAGVKQSCATSLFASA